MELRSLLNAIPERVTSSTNVRSVFGEPVSVQGKTIIPVARIRFGFGGGGGTGGGPGSGPSGEGGGGGGGGMVVPIGVVEVTAADTRFVPIVPGRKLTAIAALALLAGLWIGRRRGSRSWRHRR